MSHFIENIDATPEKRSFFAIINDYDVKMAISELVDNAIDFWKQSNSTEPLQIKIELDERQQTIVIEDNAGGVLRENMRLLVSPGASSNSQYNESIGIFGVGSKRAIVAMAQDIKIYSCHMGEAEGSLIEFNDSWLQDETWELPLSGTNDIAPGVTRIELQRLRKQINPLIRDDTGQVYETENTISDLHHHLSEIYGKIISEQDISINLNGETVTPKLFSSDWAYPPGLVPKEVILRFRVEDNRIIKVHITGGLLREGAAANGEHGVYMYCNDRLITKSHRSPQVGYVTGQAGSPDHLNIIRVIIEMFGAAKYMPWDSSKSKINFNSDVLRTIQKKVIEVVSHYAKISHSLERNGQWKEQVFPFTEGEVERIELDIEEKSIHKYLPPIPSSKPRYIDRVKKANKEITKSKNWTVGIVDSMVAYNAIQKLNLESRNRILLIILDSTLEIALKDYLVHDSGNYYSDKKLLDIFAQRHLVVKEVKKTVELPDDIWKNLNYYNGIRNKLIHERTSADINDRQLKEFKSNVEVVLNTLFGLKFT